MAIARRRLKVKDMGQANVVGPTSIEGSFSSAKVCSVSPDGFHINNITISTRSTSSNHGTT